MFPFKIKLFSNLYYICIKQISQTIIGKSRISYTKCIKTGEVSCQIKHFTKYKKQCIVMFINIITNLKNKLK